MAKKNQQYTIGVDIGGTKMNAVLFDGLEVVADYVLATPKDTLDHLLIMLKALIEPLEEKARERKIKIKGIGLGVAGVIDYEENIILESPNISVINGIKLADCLAETINLPVKIDNDANCFLRAEIKLGAGYKYNNAYGIVIGTGIGGSWYYNGEIYHGAHGGAGEPGHTIIDINSGLDLEASYQKITQNNQAALADEAYRGDVLAQKIFAEVGDYLGVAFANITNLIDPEIIIIGGSVAQSGDLFLARTRKIMRENIKSSASKKIKLVKGKIGKHAGAVGAALLADDL